MQHSVFAFEIAAHLEQGSFLRRRLHELIKSCPEQASFAHKSWMYSQVTQLLMAHMAQVELGCWDYFDDDARALKDYKMWTDGLLTEEGARTAPSVEGGRPFREAGERLYLTFTMAFLLTQGSPADLALRARCNIPQGALWRRESFVRVLQGVPAINFVSVKSDVIYLIPGDERWGLTPADLQLPKFQYLRRVEG
jgi:hypothetical protein